MLFSGQSGHRVEPVCEVRGTTRHCPIFHGVGYDISKCRVKPFTKIETTNNSLEDCLRKQRSHHVAIENIAAINFSQRCAGVVHGCLDCLSILYRLDCAFTCRPMPTVIPVCDVFLTVGQSVSHISS